MATYIEQIILRSNGNRVTYHEITDQVREIVKKSGIKNGICVVSSQHTTCSVFLEEFSHDLNYCGDEYLQVDLNNGLEKIFPRCLTEGQYHHPGPAHTKFGLEECDRSVVPDLRSLLNTEAHLKGTLIGYSQTYIVDGGVLSIGSLGYIYFADWDQNRERDRRCKVLVMGE